MQGKHLLLACSICWVLVLEARQLDLPDRHLLVLLLALRQVPRRLRVMRSTFSSRDYLAPEVLGLRGTSIVRPFVPAVAIVACANKGLVVEGRRHPVLVTTDARVLGALLVADPLLRGAGLQSLRLFVVVVVPELLARLVPPDL